MTVERSKRRCFFNVNFYSEMVCCVDAKRQLSTAKPLVNGFNFYKSGHVMTVKSCNEDTRSYIKSQVLPSMRKDLCLIIVWRNGLVQKAYCACPAGIDGRCIHVAATLSALEEFYKLRAKQEETRKACTSQKCKWNVPRKRKLDLVPIANLKFRKHEHGKLKKPRTSVISPGHGVRRAHVNNVNSRNTKVYNIYTNYKAMEFQGKTDRLLGLSHILQQHTTKNI